MEHRPLGRTGVSVSKLCLGAMMFGAWGNPDHDDSIRIIHAALDAGINFVDTADVYSRRASRRRSSARRSRAAPRRRRARDEGARPDGRRRQPAAACSRRWIIREVEDSLRRLRHRLDRPLPDPPPRPGTDIEETLGALTDLVQQGKVRYIGSSTVPGLGDRARPSGWRATGACSASSASSRRTRSSSAASRPTCCRPCALRDGRHPVEPAGRRLAVGPLAQGRRSAPASTRAARLPERYDLSLPANQRKLDAAEQLAQLAEEAGMPLIQIAIAFVLNHPAVTAAIIGPRTMEHLESQLAAADVVLDDALLDRIDEIVPPGTNLNPADAGERRLDQPGPGASGATAIDRRALGAGRRRALATAPVHAYGAAKAAPRPRLPRRCLRLEAGPTQRCASTAPRASEQQAYRSDRRISPRAARTTPGDRRTRLRARR